MSDRSGSWEERALRRLRGGGRRAGGARDAVISVLASHECALSAQEAADELSAQGRGVGIASVYRSLETLHGLGLVRRIELGKGTARFEPEMTGGEHHHHVICEACGEVTPFDDERLETAVARVERSLPHRVSSHEVVIRGTCPDCAQQRPGG